MRFVLLFAVVILILLSSCVPNRKLVLMQSNDVNRNDLPKDSVMRIYEQEEIGYKIQPNDALYIRFESLTPEEFDFFKEGNQQGGAGGARNFAIVSELVDTEGNILFPVLGKVKVSALTIFQVQDSLQAVANRYLESPIVKVRLVNFRFTLLGEVFQEGTVSTFNNRTTLPEAIGLAGGLGELANRVNIKVIRQHEGRTEVGYLNLLDENVITSPYYVVHQNDVIIVPPLKQRAYRKYFSQNLSLVITSITLLLTVINLTN